MVVGGLLGHRQWRLEKGRDWARSPMERQQPHPLVPPPHSFISLICPPGRGRVETGVPPCSPGWPGVLTALSASAFQVLALGVRHDALPRITFQGEVELS